MLDDLIAAKKQVVSVANNSALGRNKVKKWHPDGNGLRLWTQLMTSTIRACYAIIESNIHEKISIFGRYDCQHRGERVFDKHISLVGITIGSFDPHTSTFFYT